MSDEASTTKAAPAGETSPPIKVIQKLDGIPENEYYYSLVHCGPIQIGDDPVAVQITLLSSKDNYMLPVLTLSDSKQLLTLLQQSIQRAENS